MSSRRWLFAILVLVSPSCWRVLEIEERELDPTFDGSTQPSVCGDYCNTLTASCVGDHQAYADTKACLAVCQHLPAGTLGEKSGNSAACRYEQAKQAKLDAPYYCPVAGLTGSTQTDTICGSACDAYCVLMQKVCPTELAQLEAGSEKCADICAALPNKAPLHLSSSYYENSVQCRLLHLSIAAVTDPATHCAHAIGANTCVDSG